MRNEGAVERDEPQALDLTLREQHPVERIAGHRFWVHSHERMAFVDRYDPDAEASEKPKQGVELNLELELTQPALDRDLPKAGGAPMRLGVVVLQ